MPEPPPPHVPPPDRPTTEAEAIAWLVQEVPELRPLLDEHLADNDEELLSYLVFEGDFLRWFVKSVRHGDHTAARRFVMAIEPLLTTDVTPPADDRVWNLAGVCFSEGLVMQGDDDVVDVARPWMGPNTSQDINRMLRYRKRD